MHGGLKGLLSHHAPPPSAAQPRQFLWLPQAGVGPAHQPITFKPGVRKAHTQVVVHSEVSTRGNEHPCGLVLLSHDSISGTSQKKSNLQGSFSCVPEELA